MTLLAPLWLQNLASGFTASGDRQIIDALLTPGVLASGDLKVTPRATGTPLSVDVAPGRCVIEGTDTAGQGSYLAGSDATVNIALAAQPPTGQARIDLIVAQVRDSSITGSDDDWQLVAVTGTPTSGTPVVPTAPASSLVLAQIKVDGPTVTSGWITDKRTISTTPLAGYGTTLPPGRDGQITAALGTLWVSLGETWKQIGAPQPKLKTYQSTQGTYSWNQTGVETSVLPLTVPAPGYPVTAIATVSTTWNAHNGYAQYAEGWVRATVGASVTDGTHVLARSPDAFTPFPVVARLVADFDGSSSIDFAFRFKTIAASSWLDGSNNRITVELHPR